MLSRAVWILVVAAAACAPFEGVGNEGMQDIWRDVGEDDRRLRRFCEELATAQPALVEGMAAHMDDVETFLSGSPTTAP